MAARKVKDRKAAYNWSSESDWNSSSWPSSECVPNDCKESDRKSVKPYSAVSNGGKELRKPKAAAYKWISESNIYSSGCKPKDSASELDHKSEKSYLTVSTDDVTELDVGQLMNKLFVKELYTDIKFTSENGNDYVSAHSAVLAAKCQMFADQLFGNNINEAKLKERTITISNVDFSAFKKMIGYLYTGDIVFTDESTTLGIYVGAKKYKIGCLIERCESYIEFMELTEDNVCSIFQTCNDEILEDLKNRCVTYIQENTEKVISSTDFEKCTYNAIRTICNLPSLNLKSEKQVLEAAIRWIHGEPLHMKEQLIKSLLPSIRFLTFTAAEFGSIIQKYPDFLSADDALKIMLFLNGSPQERNIKNLPSWCSTNMERRCTGQKSKEKGRIHRRFPEDQSEKISVSLKTSAESEKVSEYSSLLAMMCINGHQIINAIKISFQDISLDEYIVVNATINLYESINLKVKPKLKLCRDYVLRKKENLINIHPSLFVYPGQVVIFEGKATGRTSFKLFQLDKNQDLLNNRKFQCVLQSTNEDKKLCLISEVHYIVSSKVNRIRNIRGGKHLVF